MDTVEFASELTVSMRSIIPVVGCEINPWVRLEAQASQHGTVIFTWFREQCTCSVRHVEIATPQFISCTAVHIPDQDFVSGSAPDDDSSIVMEREGSVWIWLGSSKTYTPSWDDFGFRLRLECAAIDSSTGIPLSTVNVIVTDRVIVSPIPRCRSMMPVGSMRKLKNINVEARGGSFSVLSYNILADLYVSSNVYSYCPTWALTWEYRREHLLNEILSYNADILCLQEVQSDHFEDFLKPEMAEFGYSVIYKKKTKEVYIENRYTTDGCAIFYRANRFKAIIKYEVEFDKIAQPLVETMKPDCRNEGCFRLMKDNIALVVILETVENGIVNDAICVANTHIHANSSFPDTKLFQVVNLIKGLEKISHSQIPVVICGDMNSLPGSEPHEFLISGGVEPNKEGDPLAIYQHLKPFHSMHLASAYSSLLHSGGVEEQQKEKMNTETNEPLFTLFKPTFSSTLDYILYTESGLEVCGLLELLDHEGLAGCPLPSPLWSSDHIALMTRFRFKPGCQRQQYSALPLNPWEQAAPELQAVLIEEAS